MEGHPGLREFWELARAASDTRDMPVYRHADGRYLALASSENYRLPTERGHGITPFVSRL